jgi:hypothetical protein
LRPETIAPASSGLRGGVRPTRSSPSFPLAMSRWSASDSRRGSSSSALPPTALGKDFPFDRRWVGWTPSRTGIRVNLGGYLGLSVGWVEGLEINVLSAVAGIDLRRPALKLPGLGRLGAPLLPRHAD